MELLKKYFEPFIYLLGIVALTIINILQSDILII